jgi:hypothetical protein
MLCRTTDAPTATYRRAGHSQKLVPIIDNLSSLDFSETPWSEVKTRVETMEESFQAVLLTLTFDSPQRPVVCALLEAARAALSAHNDLFANHRRLCVSALSLRS